MKNKKEAPLEAVCFEKSEIKKAKKFREFRDILEAVLEDGKLYSIVDAEAAINSFFNKEV